VPNPTKYLHKNKLKKHPKCVTFFQKQHIIKMKGIMKTKRIINLLENYDAMKHNDALRYINSTMKTGVLTKIQAPIFIDKEEIWNKALTAFWKNIAIRRLMFDYSKEDAIQRFLYTVCRKQIFQGIRQYTRQNTELLDEARVTISDDNNMECLMIQMELLSNIQQLLRKYINETEWRVLVHRFWDMMSYDEMSAVMYKTPDCLKTTKYRAINKIKKALHQDIALQAYLRFLLKEANTIN